MHLACFTVELFQHLCRRLQQLLKWYNRGEIARVEWLDHLSLNRIQQYRAEVSCKILQPRCRHSSWVLV